MLLSGATGGVGGAADSPAIEGKDNIRRSNASISSSCWRVGSWPVGGVMASSFLDVGGIRSTGKFNAKPGQK